MDILGITAALFTIVSSLFAILSPFIINTMKGREKSDGVNPSENKNIVNILFNSSLHINNNGNNSSIKKDKAVTERVFEYTREKHFSFKENSLILALMSCLVSAFNIILFLVLGKNTFFSTYIEFITMDRYLYIGLSYIVVLVTISMIYFTVSYLFMLYLYERDLENSINNNIFTSKKRKIEELSSKISHDSSISNSNSFPSPVLRRIIDNLGTEKANKIRKNKQPKKTLFKDKPLKKPLLIVLIISILFSVLPGKIYNYLWPEVRVEPLNIYDKNKELVATLKLGDKLKLIPVLLENQGYTYFNILHTDGKIYGIGFDLIKTIEPKSNFTMLGKITNSTHLRYTPYEYSGMIENSKQPPLADGQEVKVHKNTNFRNQEEWVLVRTENNNQIRQGFVYRQNLFIYPN